MLGIAHRRGSRHRWVRTTAALALITTVLTGVAPMNTVITGPAVAGAVTTFSVQPSLEQVFVTNAAAGASVELVNSGGTVSASGPADAVGSYVFRKVVPGTYTVRIGAEVSDAFQVRALTSPHPDPTFYQAQSLSSGYNYITTRDGTKLVANVFLPGPPEDGPYPTVVEYSGYDVAAPRPPLADSMGMSQATRDSLCPQMPVLCNTPKWAGSQLPYAFGYAVVAVNIRGTGCSGGAYDYFEQLQVLDGYDVIEAVAAQPWVKGHKVGMTGISYSGLSQLWVASSQPPSLAAITPMSVFDDTVRGILRPGGMFNTGFALQWISNVLNGARAYGQGWEQGRVNAGDSTCAENQRLRGFNVDSTEQAHDYTYYPSFADQYNLTILAEKIRVPVFLMSQWQDEQTGGRFSLMWKSLKNAPVVKLIGTNGMHSDPFTPQILVEMKAFLDFYVAGELTDIPPLLRFASGDVFQPQFGTELYFPPMRWLSYGSFSEAKAAFEAEPGVTIIYDRGRGPVAGAPTGGFVVRYTSWPPPGAAAKRWYFQPDGTATSTAPTAIAGASRLIQDPSRGTLTTGGPALGNEWGLTPGWNWRDPDAASSVVYDTTPFTAMTAFAGPGSIDLWLRSSTTDAELEVTLTELRPDGTEMFIQNGWATASYGAISSDSTEVMPLQHYYENGNSALVPGEWRQLRVLLFPFAHIVRPGSRLRMIIHSPGGNMLHWAFDTNSALSGSSVDIAHNSVRPSSMALQTVPLPWGASSAVAPCPSLRGQPCRTTKPITNQIGEATQMPVVTTTTTTTTTAPSSTITTTTAAPTTSTSTTVSSRNSVTTTTRRETAVKAASQAAPAKAVAASPTYTG